MSTGSIIALVIALILLAAIIVLYILGKRAQKKQDEQNAAMQANKQSVTMLVIDKKRMKIKESGLPQMVIDQTPKALRGSKLPIVKAKVGPQIMTLVCDEKIFGDLPVKKEIKASVSGIYILEYKLLHGKVEAPAETKKKSKWRKMVEKMQEKAGATPIK